MRSKKKLNSSQSYHIHFFISHSFSAFICTCDWNNVYSIDLSNASGASSLWSATVRFFFYCSFFQWCCLSYYMAKISHYIFYLFYLWRRRSINCAHFFFVALFSISTLNCDVISIKVFQRPKKHSAIKYVWEKMLVMRKN